MCLFTHFAAGALAGAATGHIWLGSVAGLASHAVLDALPHYDHPDWRVELAGGVAALLLLLMLPFWTWPAVLGGIMGMVPDLENLFQKLGRLRRERFIYPTHTGLIPHGRVLAPSSLVWQVVLFLVCFGAMGLLAPEHASAAPAAARENTIAATTGPVMDVPRINLIESRDHRTRLRFQFPTADESVDWTAVDSKHLAWREPPPAVEYSPDEIVTAPPSAYCTVALATREPAQWRVTAVAWHRPPDRAVAPASLVRVHDPVIYREVPLSKAMVLPVSEHNGVLAALELELLHAPSGLQAVQLAAASAVSGYRQDDPVPESVINPELFRSLQRGAKQWLRERNRSDAAARADAAAKGDGKDAVARAFGLSDNWVKLEVDATGVYKVTGYDLLGLGVIPATVNPATIRVFKGGAEALAADPETPLDQQTDRWQLRELAVDVRDADDGQWDLDDSLLFYGVGTSTWLDRIVSDAPALDHFEHPFADLGTYWITWEDYGDVTPFSGDPLRVTPPIDASPNGGEVITSHRGRLHEERSNFDTPGLFADNWTWDPLIIGRKDIDVNLPDLVAGSEVSYVIDVRGDARWLVDSYVYGVRAFLNDDEAGADSTSIVVSVQSAAERTTLEGESMAGVSGTNVLTLHHFTYASSSNPYKEPLALDSFDVTYWGLLNKVADQQLAVVHWRDQVMDADAPHEFRFALPGTEAVTLWDVSDPLACFQLAGQQSSSPTPSYVAGLLRQPDTDRHLVLFSEEDLFAPTTLSVEHPRDLWNDPALDPETIDYVVVYHRAFADAATALAGLRNEHIPGVSSPTAVAVAVDDVYACFSAGQKDPLAIRNFLRWLYYEGAMQLKYVCLLGKASRDYRNYRNHDPAVELYDFMPTVVRTFYPTIRYETSEHFKFYATDDALVEFHSYSVSDGILDPPDLAIGRLPASSAEVARELVEHIVEYSREPPEGPWRNKALFVADDMRSLTNPERAHTVHSEFLSNNHIPKTMEVEKIYLALYITPASAYKPEARQDLIAALNAGTTIFNYVGHGGDTVLADEHVFRFADIASLTNGGRRAVMMAYSCDVGVFDDPDKVSMAEEFVLQSDGGGIGAICSSQISYIHHNELLSKMVFCNLFPDTTVAATRTLGMALNLGKVDVAIEKLFSFSYMKGYERYPLLGDPAIRLPNPVGDLEFDATTPGTMYGGALHTVTVDLAAQGVAAGTGVTYDLRVEESARDIDHPIGEIAPFTVKHMGASVFRGNGAAHADPLRISFKIPTQMTYGDQGKVRIILDTPEGQRAAYHVVTMNPATVSSNDVIGPAIDLTCEDRRYRANVGTNLVASLADTSGIGILGTYPNNSVLIEYDGNGYMTDVSESFVFEPGSYTQGRIAVPLPADLELGEHVAALHASDILGNVGSDTLSFLLVAEGITEFHDVTVFPNPTPGPCRLIFETSDPLDVAWDIYTLSGRRINSISRQYDTAGIKILSWNGRDQWGDEIANGTYLYVLRGSWADGEGGDITETGKLVIMR